MDEKKADNKIMEVRKQISATEERLADSRKKLRGIEDLEDNLSDMWRKWCDKRCQWLK